jgi:two-component system cell cycle response regulator
MLLLDLDHFKRVNDIGGHSAGDQVLKHVASVLMTSVRETDLVARYGGEEFAILLPATSHENALKVAEHVRRAISAHPCDGLRISASIGVASGVVSILDPDFGPECCPLVAQADAALYAAKGAGRNQVASAEGPSRLLADELLR